VDAALGGLLPVTPAAVDTEQPAVTRDDEAAASQAPPRHFSHVVRLAPVAFAVTSPLRPVRPLVSVIVSTRNHSRYIAQMVDAVMAQDLDDEVELVVCDNASTDDTEAVVRDLAAKAKRPLTYIRLRANFGPALGRNIALARATGRFLAFTDSDCVPDPGWLRAALAAFDRDGVGIVQGRTVPLQRRNPLFSHFIEIDHLDGTFATANVVYRRQALGAIRFRGQRYMEDVDLGWRVRELGWDAVFAPDAVVAHQVIPVTWWHWLTWATRYGNWPAITHAHHRARTHLLFGIWQRPLNLWLELAIVGLLAGIWWHPAWLLVLPYVVAFVRAHGLGGRFPPAKAALHLAHDVLTVASLGFASIRHRSLVL
jgi:glycosyltransferase involved in cell wall biosynthesis